MVYHFYHMIQSDPLLPNRSINISTRETGNVNINAEGNGFLICNVSGTSRMIINHYSTSINYSLNVSAS